MASTSTAPAPFEIQVYASFPHAVVPGLNLNVAPSNWHWVHCLTLPIETFNALNFSQRPYKWIRYAIGVVIGARGDLSLDRDSPNVGEFDENHLLEPAILYYHTSNEEKRRMFPADPSIGRTIITSSVATSQEGQFPKDVARRDLGMCILTSISKSYCDAVHLLAHSKGDDVRYSFSHSILAHHLHGGSTLRLIPGAAVETLKEATLYARSTALETACFCTIALTVCWVSMLHS
jgi:hypothetical protein